MNRIEKRLSQELSDSISQQVQLLGAMGFVKEAEKVLVSLGDINRKLALSDFSPTISDMKDYLLNDARKIRDSVYAGHGGNSL